MKGRKLLILIPVVLVLIAIAYYRPWNTRKPPDPPHAVTQVTPKIDDNADESPRNPAPRRDLRQNYCLNPHQTTCRTKWPSEDPTGKVGSDVRGEIRALRHMRNIIQKNPSWTSEQVQESLAEVIYTPERRGRAENGFQWVMNAVRVLIQEQPETVLSETEKEAILGRLAQIRLELPPPASVYADAIDLVTKNTVYYERTPQDILRLRMGGAYLLNTTSWYNLIFTLAHELAHSIDPCEARNAGIYPPAYDGLISCFIEQGWVTRDRSECGPNEQISEVFADWIAAEVTGKAIAEFGKEYTSLQLAQAAINSTRDLCEQTTSVDSLNLQLHQRPQIRIGSVMGRNPIVRSALSCSNRIRTQSYCSFQSSGARAPSQENRP